MTASKGCICRREARAWTPSGVCATCGQHVLEAQLTPVVLQVLCAPGSGLVLWRNARGYDADRKIRYGVGDGGADYIGLYAPAGRFVSVELKTARGRQQDNQRQWEQLVLRLGGVYALVRSVDDARILLERLRSEVGR